MITFICGPMYSGKSSALYQRLERCLYAKKKVLLIRPIKDDRGYFVHSGGIDLEALEKKFEGKFVIKYYNKLTDSDCHSFSDENFDAVFVDEYFMIEDSWLLTQWKKFDVYYSGLLATSECKLTTEAIKILPYCDKIKKLNGICIECGSELGSYSFYKYEKSDEVVVGDDSYECLCHECYEKKQMKKLYKSAKPKD